MQCRVVTRNPIEMVLKRVFQSSHSLFVIFHSDSKGEQNETEARVQSMIAVTVTCK